MLPRGGLRRGKTRCGSTADRRRSESLNHRLDIFDVLKERLWHYGSRCWCCHRRRRLICSGCGRRCCGKGSDFICRLDIGLRL